MQSGPLLPYPRDPCSVFPRWMKMFYAIAVSRYALALVFCVAASGKVRARGDFEESVRAMTGVSGGRAPLVAGSVIGCEAIAAVLLAVPRTGPLGALLATVLLLSFTFLILRLIARREEVACSCFGASGSPAGWLQVGRNVILLAMAAMSAHAWQPEPLRPGLLTAAFAAAVVAALVVSLEDLIFLFSPVAGPMTYDM